jgi:hypothetical protein
LVFWIRRSRRARSIELAAREGEPHRPPEIDAAAPAGRLQPAAPARGEALRDLRRQALHLGQIGGPEAREVLAERRLEVGDAREPDRLPFPLADVGPAGEVERGVLGLREPGIELRGVRRHAVGRRGARGDEAPPEGVEGGVEDRKFLRAGREHRAERPVNFRAVTQVDDLQRADGVVALGRGDREAARPQQAAEAHRPCEEIPRARRRRDRHGPASRPG